jgi:hypothetical protein
VIKRRKRVKQTLTFKDRLTSFAADLRQKASELPDCELRKGLLERAGRADTAAEFDDWAACAMAEISRVRSRLQANSSG